MPKQTFTAYVDDKGKPVLQQNKPGGWELIGIYGQVDPASAKRLHAALGELLTDLAENPALAGMSSPADDA